MTRPPRSIALWASVLLFATLSPSQDDAKAGRGLRVTPDPANGPTPTAGTNITLVRKWRRTTSGYNDIWGWTSPTGREFAYVGERRGIWFVETTDPNNIRQVGWWSAPRSIWRDFTNLGHYVYAVSEHHAGIRVFDMSNPSAPRYVGAVATSQIRKAHNIRADPATKHLYVCGTNQGLAIYDASVNPTNPRLVATWGTSYTHDAVIRRGKAYLSNGKTYFCRIMDASNPSRLREIGRAPTLGGYNHNVWVSEDDKVMCVTDEIDRNGNSAHMSIFDISNPARPIKRSIYDLGTTVHNVFVMGRTAYMSHYANGFQMVDLADLSRPVRIAEYDTNLARNGTEGAWGVWPFSDSGLIYVSDIDNGLFVFRVTAGHINRYQKGVAGSDGRTPRIKLDGATPRVGASGLELKINGLRPHAPAALLISNSKGDVPFLGVRLNVNPAAMMVIRFQADATGRAVLPAPVPNNAGLANNRIYFQVLAADPGLPNGLSASRGHWTGIAQ